MSVLTINAFPSTATITATYNEETITGIGQVVIEANDSTVVSYTVEAQQCTSKSGTFTISGDMTEAVALNYIGSVSVDTWVPSTGRDTFPTHIAMLGKGGWRSVESNDERDAIPSARREAGMSVYVTSTNKVYILDNDLVTWNELESGKVDDVRLHNVSVVNSKIANLETVRQVTTLPVEPLIAGEIVQYIGNTNANYTNGYFYKQTGRNTTYSNLQFTPLGDYEIEVSISDEDLNTFLNKTVRQTDYPVVSGRFGYYQQTPEVLWYLSGTSGHQSDGFSYSNTPEGYAEQGFTVTPPIGPQQGLDYTVENTTTWVWEQVDVQPNPTVYESFYRGRFDTFTLVPTDTQYYQEDFHGSKIPEKNDYMVVSDASDYNSGDITELTVNSTDWGAQNPAINITVKDVGTGNYVYLSLPSSKASAQTITGSTYKIYRTNGGYSIFNPTYSFSVGNTTYQPGEEWTWAYSYQQQNVEAKRHIDRFGAWRFRYDGVWTTDGKNGWLPEYQLENVLPIATDTEPGITKLYNTTGQNTDGAVDQATVTTELGKKQDTLTPGTGIDISTDASTGNLVISNTSTESFFRGPFADWASVPTSANGYYPDIYGNKTPKNTDYIIIEDASQVPSGGTTVTMTMRTETYGNVPTQELTTVIGSDSYSGFGTFGGGEIQVRMEIVSGLYSVIWKNLKSEVVFGGSTYPVGSDFNKVPIDPSNNGTSTATLGIGYPYSGTWRFSYRGQWNLEGRGGWKGEYAVEETLPIATDQIAGIMKLYTTTGNNTDGTMDQNSITGALDTLDSEKQDNLVEGTGIHLDTVTNEISTQNVVWRKW